MTGGRRRSHGSGRTPVAGPGPAALLVRFAAMVYLTIVLSMVSWTLLPLVLRWQPVVVLSGSMEPSMRRGDVVLYERVAVEQLVPGQVLLVDDPVRPGGLLSHRLVRRDPDGLLVTKGDANQSEDSTPIAPGAVHGRARLLVPYLGRMLLWRDGAWREAAPWLLALAAAIVVVSGGRAEPARSGTAPAQPVATA
jgi:signal peptidase